MYKVLLLLPLLAYVAHGRRTRSLQPSDEEVVGQYSRSQTFGKLLFAFNPSYLHARRSAAVPPRRMAMDEGQAAVPMPSKLSEWGVHEWFWSQIRQESKEKLEQLLLADNRTDARELLKRIRRSIGRVSAMPSELAAWDCDEDLWNIASDVNKFRLLNFTKLGNEKEARELISELRAGRTGSMPPKMAMFGCDEETWQAMRQDTGYGKKVVRSLSNLRKKDTPRGSQLVSSWIAARAKNLSIPPVLVEAGLNETMWNRLAKRRLMLSKLCQEGKADEALEMWRQILHDFENWDIMPAKLAEWGCDQALWDQIRSKRGALFRMAREGPEEVAREEIKKQRVLLSKSAAKSVPKAKVETVPEAVNDFMPSDLIAWGCDETFWSRIKSKAKRASLRQFAKEGNEEEARKIIASLREIMELQDQITMDIKQDAQDSPGNESAVLAAWGCDESLWMQIKSKGNKRILRRYAREGDEKGAQTLIERIKRLIQAEATRAEAKKAKKAQSEKNTTKAKKPVPAEFAALGVDDVLWPWLGKNLKAQLLNVSREGKETKTRELIAQLQMGLIPNYPMPFELAAFCDNKSWKIMRGTRLKLVDFVREGKEKEAVELVEKFKSDAKYAELTEVVPADLAAWGMDQEFWNRTKNKKKKQYRWLARRGLKANVISIMEEEREKFNRAASNTKKQSEVAVVEEVPEAMPVQLADWGCDESLWESISVERKRDLSKFAREGKDTKARKIIKDAILRRRLRETKSLPPEMAALGCENTTWVRISGRRLELIDLVSAGKTDEARKMIEQIQSDFENWDTMPAALADWGCDQALWNNTATKRGALFKYLNAGEEKKARDMIAQTRASIKQATP